MSSDEKIQFIDRSPEAVGVHDKNAWLALFASDGEVNDPVGSRPHRGEAAISRFYDTFIAPNNIRFEVEHDVVSGDTVVRDLDIHTELSTGLKIAVPTHIRYELKHDNGELKIQRLSAHWELSRMVMQTLSMGLIGIVTYAKLSVHMLRCQGLGGVLGFMRGFLGVGAAGRRRAEAFLTAAARNDSRTARMLLEASDAVQLLEGGHQDIGDVVSQVQGLRWSKLTVAGRHVTATCHVGDRRGVAWLEFGQGARQGRRIQRGRFYLPDS